MNPQAKEQVLATYPLMLQAVGRHNRSMLLGAISWMGLCALGVGAGSHGMSDAELFTTNVAPVVALGGARALERRRTRNDIALSIDQAVLRQIESMPSEEEWSAELWWQHGGRTRMRLETADRVTRASNGVDSLALTLSSVSAYVASASVAYAIESGGAAMTVAAGATALAAVGLAASDTRRFARRRVRDAAKAGYVDAVAAGVFDDQYVKSGTEADILAMRHAALVVEADLRRIVGGETEAPADSRA